MLTFYSYIVKFIFALHLGLSKPQMNNILSLMHGIIFCEGRKTVAQLRRQTKTTRNSSCMTRFLSESPWNHHTANRRCRRFLQRLIQRKQVKYPDKQIVFLLLDDSNCKKLSLLHNTSNRLTYAPLR